MVHIDTLLRVGRRLVTGFEWADAEWSAGGRSVGRGRDASCVKERLTTRTRPVRLINQRLYNAPPSIDKPGGREGRGDYHRTPRYGGIALRYIKMVKHTYCGNII